MFKVPGIQKVSPLSIFFANFSFTTRDFFKFVQPAAPQIEILKFVSCISPRPRGSFFSELVFQVLPNFVVTVFFGPAAVARAGGSAATARPGW